MVEEIESRVGCVVDAINSGKISTFEGRVQVSCIVWGSLRLPAGKIYDMIVSTLDKVFHYCLRVRLQAVQQGKRNHIESSGKSWTT